jgi:hypothetical protein
MSFEICHLSFCFPYVLGQPGNPEMTNDKSQMTYDKSLFALQASVLTQSP